MTRIVALSGSLNRPSKTLCLVEIIAKELQARTAGSLEIIDIATLLPALGTFVRFDQPVRVVTKAHDRLCAADVLVIGSPVYKASYTGMFKHFLDLLDPGRLRGKVAILAATGGSDRHALVLEHQLRPLLSFFDVNTVPAGVYACDQEFVTNGDQVLVLREGAVVKHRIDIAIDQALRLLDTAPLALAKSSRAVGTAVTLTASAIERLPRRASVLP